MAADTLIIGAYTTVATQYKVFHVLGWSPAGMGFAVGGGLLIVGFVLALLAAFPNVRFRGFRMDVGGVFYFGKIGSQDFEAYVREFHACDQGQALDRELLSQVWAKSRWLIHMFRFIQGSIGCTLAGTLVSVAILLAMAHRL